MKSWRTRCFWRQMPRSTSDSFSWSLSIVAKHGSSGMGGLFSKLWPCHRRGTVTVLVKNVAEVAFWRAMGYTDYELTLGIMPCV